MKTKIFFILLLTAPLFAQEYIVKFTKQDVLEYLIDVNTSLLNVNDQLLYVYDAQTSGGKIATENFITSVNDSLSYIYYVLCFVDGLLDEADVTDSDISFSMNRIVENFRIVKNNYEKVQTQYIQLAEGEKSISNLFSPMVLLMKLLLR